MSLTAPVLTPPLHNGDRLSRDEFMRRWEAMPNLRQAELINGVVFMPSPVSMIHGEFHGRVSAWMSFYVAVTPGCAFLPGTTWLMADNGAPQPDLALEIRPEFGGQARVEGKYAAGAPELIVEVSHTTSTRDSGEKLRLYQRSGVKEYIIVRPAKQKIVWHSFSGSQHRHIEPDTDGLLKSRVFPGLWLNPEQLWNSDFPGFASTTKRASATAEHKAFVRTLSRRKR